MLYPLINLALSVGLALAQTSLYIPGFDPQPLSADILGTDSNGRTTWAIHQGVVTGTYDPGSLPGTATLVEGPNGASFTLAIPSLATLGLDCTFSGDQAICSGVEGGTTYTATESITRIEVQAGTTAPPATVTGTGSSVVITSSKGLTSVRSGSQSSATTTAQTSQQTSNGANTLSPYFSPLFAIVASVAMLIRF